MASASAPHGNPNTRVGLTGAAAAATLTDLDWKLIRWQHQLKEDLPERPKQTGFRVFSILTYKPRVVPAKEATYKCEPMSHPHPFDNHMYVEGTNKELAYVTGTNTEPCFIGNSICSERSAILQMRMKHYVSIEKLYITADADNIITPGLLCREMLCEFLWIDTPIILASWAPSEPNGYDVQVATLRELFPFPHIYLNVPGSTVTDFASHFHSQSEKFNLQYASKPAWTSLYEAVKESTKKDGRPSLHPLKYAAGVLFKDGTTRCQAMTKVLEYGWSLDPVIKLVPFLEEKKEQQIQPELILICDHFGNLHSPSAPARSHLTEYSYQPVLIFHNRQGKLVQTDAQSLAPDVPDAIADVLPQTVRQSSASTHSGVISPSAPNPNDSSKQS
jgi:cytidine deaminase